MKKLRGIMAILAATALIFGTVACSDGGGNDNNNNKTPTDQSDPISGGGGSGTSDPTTGGGGSAGGSTTVDPVSYCWNFQTTTIAEVKAVNAGGSYEGKYVLSEDYEYASTPSGMILTMGKGDAANGFVYNKIAPDQTLGSSTVYYVNGSNTDSTAGATIGAIEPAGDLVSLKNVQGPFTVKAYVQGNSSSDKTDRYGYIKIAGEEVYAPNKANTTLPAAGQILTYTYDASDKVDVVIGCAKYMRIYDVVVTTAAAQDQSTSETNAASMTLSADKTSAKVGSKVTWTLTANNMDVPSTVDIYVDGGSTPFITGAALTNGKYEMTVKKAWLEADEDDDPIETTVKVFVKSGNVSSNKVTITFVPADNISLYSDGTLVNWESDFTVAEITYLKSMSDAEIETLVAGRYTDAACETPVTEGYEGDIYIKLNKTKADLKAWIDAAIAAATKYTVTFDANGGAFATGTTISVEVVSGLTVSEEQLAPLTPPTRTDYTLLGWATTADATEPVNIKTVTISDNTTFYAVWKAVFSSFVATDTGKTADSGSYEALTSSDGLVKTTARAKYQANIWSTHDYNAETGAGYTYTARVKLNKKSGDVDGTLTISNVKVGSVLRIDGGNASTDVRTVAFTGTDTDSTKWEASTMGTIYVTATASTVVLTSETNEFCIYGIHVVDAKVDATIADTTTTYTKPTVELSTDSCLKDAEVTITVTVPDAAVKTTYTDGKVVNSTTPVTETVTISGATVSDGKVDTSAAGTLTITASYTIGETAYTSDAVTLVVSSGFAVSTQTVTNDEATLGLTATTVSSSNTDAATVAITDAGIVITSVAAGEATITFGDGTNEGTIDVTVGAGGDITATVNKYSAFNAIILDWSADSSKTDTTTFAKDSSSTWNGLNVIALASAVTETSSGLSIANCRFDIGSDSSTATTASDTTVAGDIKFVDGYDIKVTVTYTSELASGKSSGAFQVFLDNNTGSASKSLLGNSSKLSKAGTVPQTTSATLVNTIDCSAIQAAYDAKTGVSVSGHYIAIRADSGCVATVTAIKIEYVEVTE